MSTCQISRCLGYAFDVSDAAATAAAAAAATAAATAPAAIAAAVVVATATATAATVAAAAVATVVAVATAIPVGAVHGSFLFPWLFDHEQHQQEAAEHAGSFSSRSLKCAIVAATDLGV